MYLPNLILQTEIREGICHDRKSEIENKEKEKETFWNINTFEMVSSVCLQNWENTGLTECDARYHFDSSAKVFLPIKQAAKLYSLQLFLAPKVSPCAKR